MTQQSDGYDDYAEHEAEAEAKYRVWCRENMLDPEDTASAVRYEDERERWEDA